MNKLASDHLLETSFFPLIIAFGNESGSTWNSYNESFVNISGKLMAGKKERLYSNFYSQNHLRHTHTRYAGYVKERKRLKKKIFFCISAQIFEFLL